MSIYLSVSTGKSNNIFLHDEMKKNSYLAALIKQMNIMDISQSTKLYFSPTGSTRKIVREIALAANLNCKETDLTTPGTSAASLIYSKDDFLLLGFPVYSGRVPETLCKRLESLRGDNTPVVFVATYGNREYDDALLEMSHILTRKGFKVIAAAAFITQHSIVPSIAADRPDEVDMNAVHEFGKRLVDKAQAITDPSDLPPLSLKGNFPYREYKGIPFKPHATKACIGCGLCAAKCPTGAIPADTPSITLKDKCISCMRCIKICLEQARRLKGIERFLVKMAIASKCKVRKMPEYFGV